MTESTVYTECGHYFHEECLVFNVNGSGMENGHLCPTCRFVLCEPGERTHISQSPDGSGDSEDE